MNKPLAAAGKLQERCNELQAENALLRAQIEGHSNDANRFCIENVALREELAEEKRLLAEESQQYEDLRESYDRVCSELAAAQTDAKRYRWLRHGDNDEPLIQFGHKEQCAWLLRNEKLDAAIDDAIAKEKTE